MICTCGVLFCVVQVIHVVFFCFLFEADDARSVVVCDHVFQMYFSSCLSCLLTSVGNCNTACHKHYTIQKNGSCIKRLGERGSCCEDPQGDATLAKVAQQGLSVGATRAIGVWAFGRVEGHPLSVRHH
jgi:hypothetical protein